MTELDDLTARLDQLTAKVTDLTHEVNEIAAALLPAPDDPAENTNADTPRPVAPAFATLEGWVTGFFIPTFRRQYGGELRWCSQWQEHVEALLRLEALWRSWEALRQDPLLGIATWLTNYADPQLAALTQRTGTFANCTLDRHAH
jgi:hypothetical protein